MRSIHFFPLPILLGLCSVVALVSCRMSTPREHPPEEVLRRAIVNNALLDHVGYHGNVHLLSDTFSGSLSVSGGLEGGGVSWWFSGLLHGTYSSENQHSSFSGAITAMSLNHHTLAVRIDSAQGILGDRLMTSIVRSDTPPWLVIESSTGSVALQSRSRVDALNVDAIVSSLRIISASPLTRTSFGSYQYVLSVQTASGSSETHLSEWKGDIVIDGRTFELISVRWVPVNFRSTPAVTIDSISLNFEPELPLTKPHLEGAVVPLTIESLTDIILGKPLLP